jgi:hypothetical protein
MTRPRSQVFAAVFVAAFWTLAPSLAAEPDAKKSINAADLLNIQVIGVLGHPLGQLTTIRGTWHLIAKKEQAVAMVVIEGNNGVVVLGDEAAMFHVTQINGKPTQLTAEFKGSVVHPLSTNGWKAGARGIAWDWVCAGRGDRQPPSPKDVKEGEEWEMMGTESGYFSINDNSQLFKELSVQVLEKQFGPSYNSTFTFTFIAVRQIPPEK